MILHKSSRIENKTREGLLDLFKDRFKIGELYKVNRLLFAKIKKLDSISNPKVLTTLDYQYSYQWIEFSKKFNGDSIFVEFFISLDKEIKKVPSEGEEDIDINKYISSAWRYSLNENFLTFDINSSEWKIFITSKTVYNFSEGSQFPQFRDKEGFAFHSDGYNLFLSPIERNGDRLEYKKESDEIVRFRIVEVTS